MENQDALVSTDVNFEVDMAEDECLYWGALGTTTGEWTGQTWDVLGTRSPSTSTTQDTDRQAQPLTDTAYIARVVKTEHDTGTDTWQDTNLAKTGQPTDVETDIKLELPTTSTDTVESEILTVIYTGPGTEHEPEQTDTDTWQDMNLAKTFQPTDTETEDKLELPTTNTDAMEAEILTVICSGLGIQHEPATTDNDTWVDMNLVKTEEPADADKGEILTTNTDTGAAVIAELSTETNIGQGLPTTNTDTVETEMLIDLYSEPGMEGEPATTDTDTQQDMDLTKTVLSTDTETDIKEELPTTNTDKAEAEILTVNSEPRIEGEATTTQQDMDLAKTVQSTDTETDIKQEPLTPNPDTMETEIDLHSATDMEGEAATTDTETQQDMNQAKTAQSTYTETDIKQEPLTPNPDTVETEVLIDRFSEPRMEGEAATTNTETQQDMNLTKTAQSTYTETDIKQEPLTPNPDTGTGTEAEISTDLFSSGLTIKFEPRTMDTPPASCSYSQTDLEAEGGTKTCTWAVELKEEPAVIKTEPDDSMEPYPPGDSQAGLPAQQQAADWEIETKPWTASSEVQEAECERTAVVQTWGTRAAAPSSPESGSEGHSSSDEREKPLEAKSSRAVNKPFICDKCGKGFIQRSHLKVHERIHTGFKPHVCELCNKAFSEAGKLTKHKKIHAGIKPHVCNVCNKAFSEAGNLRRHMRIHTGFKPHVCDLCEMAFVTAGHLRKHMKVHMEDKSYVCEVCDRGFVTAGHLTIHKRIHSGVKPHVCNVCSEAFTTAGSLSIHKRIHSEIKSHVCEVCLEAFSTLGQLTTHKKTHKGFKPHACVVCSKAFSQSAQLTKHMRTHKESKHVCDVCFKEFTTAGNLTLHMKIHAGFKPFVCETCSKAFSRLHDLTRHERTHTGVKPHICDVCGKGFTMSSNLTRHKRIHTDLSEVETI